MSFFIGQWVDWWLGTSFLSVGTGTGKNQGMIIELTYFFPVLSEAFWMEVHPMDSGLISSSSMGSGLINVAKECSI